MLNFGILKKLTYYLKCYFYNVQRCCLKIQVTNMSPSEDRRVPVYPCNTGPDPPSGGTTGDFLIYIWTQQRRHAVKFCSLVTKSNYMGWVHTAC